ncbi:MAG: ATP-binding protein [Promethearchaeota archaeon]
MIEVIFSEDFFEGIINLIAMIIFIIGIFVTIFIFWKKRTATSILVILLMIGGFLYSIGEVIESFELFNLSEDIFDIFIIFIASMLLITGLIVLLEQKLIESEEIFRHLFESSPYSIILLTLNGRIIECNSATEKLFIYKKDDLKGKKFINLSADPSELKTIIKQRLEIMFKGGLSKSLDYQFYKKDGTLVWVNLHISLYKLGNESFIQTMIQEITERKKAEKIIQEEIEKLKEIDQIRSDLVRRTSHELKTPLISIYSSTNYLLNNLKDEMNDDFLKFIETINRSGNRLKLLTENLLDVYNLESYGFRLNKVKVNINEIVNQCVNDMTLLLKSRELFLKLELNEIYYLKVDKHRIEQVILNLLSNAIKNTPPKGIIYISLKKQNNFLDMIIKDTGIGITKDEKDKLFKKFGKIERYEKGLNVITEGSGLGLYISREIVELHNGEIWVESEGRNKGSTFIVRLPIK